MVLKEQAQGRRGHRQDIEAFQRFPWAKAILGGSWTVFWLVATITMEAIDILFPFLLMLGGVVFLIVLIIASDEAVIDIALDPAEKKSKTKEE